jgi:hypothetical protein
LWKVIVKYQNPIGDSVKPSYLLDLPEEAKLHTTKGRERSGAIKKEQEEVKVSHESVSVTSSE